MKIFKNFIKVLFRGYKIPILLYIIIYAIISIISTSANSNNMSEAFETKKINVSVIDNDNSTLSKGIIDYIDDTCTLIKLNENDINNLKDVVFYRKSCVVITIPKGFEESFLGNQELKLDKICLPDSSEVYIVDSYINKYLNFTEAYIEQGFDYDEALNLAKNDLQISINVNLVDKNKKELASFVYYYEYLPYPIIAILILCISTVLVYYNGIDLKRRNTISPISLSSFNMQLLLGAFSVPLIIDIVFIAISFALYGKEIFCLQGLIVIINFFVFSMVCLCMSFLISNLAKEKTISAISTVLSLGMCFLGGVFVPIELLGKGVRSIAIINPVYWYTKVNYLIGCTVTLNSAIIKESLYYMFIQICFAVAFFSVSLVVIKQKRVSKN